MFFNLLKRKTNTIGKIALILTSFTVFSSVLAIVRDKLLSSQFGAGEILDTYLAAFRIPDIIFLLTATLISTFVLLPLFEKEESKSKQDLQNFIDKVFWTFAIFIFAVSAIMFFLTPFLAKHLFAGFSPEQLETLIVYSRLMLLSPIFMGLSFVFMSVNHKYSYFIPVALTGIVYNLSIIFGILILYPIFGFWGVIFGVVFGAFLYLAIQLPSVFKEELFIKKFSLFSFRETGSILKVSLPRSVALFITDIVSVLLIAKATFFGSGAVTMLNFSLNIFAVPLNIIAISYSIAVFPKLAKAYVQDKIEDLKIMSRDIISRILFFAIPISLFFVFFSNIIVGFLLGSSKFALKEIEATAFFVSILSIVIVFQSISIMIVRIFYAMGKTWVPLFVNSSVFILLFILIYFFEGWNLSSLIFSNLPEQTMQISNLLIPYIISFAFGSLLIYYTFKKSIKNFSLFKNSSFFKKFIISFGAVIFAKIIYIFWRPNLINNFWYFFVDLLIAGISFLIIFILLSEILKEKNYLEFKKKVLFYCKKVIIKLWK